jgi:hypothetical protein
MPNVAGERFQITIDKNVREELGIKAVTGRSSAAGRSAGRDLCAGSASRVAVGHLAEVRAQADGADHGLERIPRAGLGLNHDPTRGPCLLGMERGRED